MKGPNPTINKEHFHQRVERLYEYWNTGVHGLNSLNAISVVFGNGSNPYTKSSALHSWLLEAELIDTVLLFLKDHIYILGSSRKAEFFGPVISDKFHGKVPPISTMIRDKTDKDGKNFQRLVGLVSEAGGSVGTFTKEKFSSEFVDSWNKVLEENDVKKTDISLAFTHLFAVKDDKEIKSIRKSAEITNSTWTLARAKYLDIIGQEKKVRHSQLSKDFAEILQKSTKGTDTCYDPIVMSGGDYYFKWNHESSQSHLHSQFGSIVTSFGARFHDYCSNLTRTMLVFPSSELKNAYQAILEAEQAVMNALRPGAKLCDVYQVGIQKLTEKNPKLVETLNKKELGFATGIEFRESRLAISPKCEELVKSGMVFIVYIGVDGIENRNDNGELGKPAAIAISDTVLVKEHENEVLTEQAKSRLKSNVIRFDENANENMEVEKPLGRGQRSVVLNEQTRNKKTNEENRRERQKELGRQLNEAARARRSGEESLSDQKKSIKSNMAYKSPEKFPVEGNRMMIYVDRKNQSIILPIYGVPIPFHISMIKNCSQVMEGDWNFLRINFSTIMGAPKEKEILVSQYLKEITYRTNGSELTTAFRLIKDLQKQYRTEMENEKEKEGAVKQDKLIVSHNRLNPKLKDLLIRPNITQKVKGSLEAHTNGFRYSTHRGDRIDVLYNNIKHAFFQPCDNELIILLHFHLKNPVIWGKKKYQDVQFYTEVGEIATDLGKYHHERDDMRGEQQEREMRRRLNNAFHVFCEKVTRLTNEQFEFDTPFADLGFLGVPYRSTTMLKPTSSCLVNLTEWPSFIVSLADVELVHFERVSFSHKNFDMVFVPKDYSRKPQTVTLIPMSSLEMIKEWLHSCDIKYSEGILSLNWANLMITATNDDFFEKGGWEFLDAESDRVEEESDESDDEAFVPEGDVNGSDGSDGSDGSENEDEENSDEEEEEEGSVDSDESEGKEWSDLEEEAAMADDRREMEVDRKRSGRNLDALAPAHKRRR